MPYYGVVVHLVVKAANSTQAEIDVRTMLAQLQERGLLHIPLVESVVDAGDYTDDDRRADS